MPPIYMGIQKREEKTTTTTTTTTKEFGICGKGTPDSTI